MKAIVSKDKNLINLYLKINNKKYCIPNISYEDTHQIMRTFVQKSILPKEKTYMEIVEEEHNKKMMDSFVALVELLFKDSKLAKSFLNKINLKNIEDDTEELWFKLYNELLLKEKVIELDWKEEKDIFLYSVKELSAGTNLVIDEHSYWMRIKIFLYGAVNLILYGQIMYWQRWSYTATLMYYSFLRKKILLKHKN